MPSKWDILKREFGHNDWKKVKEEDYEDVQMRPDDLEELRKKFPYRCPAEELPAPLPTDEEILAAQGTPDDILRDRLHSNYCVFRIRDVFAVKFGDNPVILHEAENMLYLEKNCKVRIPKVYAVYETPTFPGYYFIVMEFIKGINHNGNTWIALSHDDKMDFCDKLVEQLRLLRSVPPPSPHYFGRVGHGGFEPQSLLFGTRSDALCGPYEDYESCISGIQRFAEYSAAVNTLTHDFSPAQELLLTNLRDSLLDCENKDPVLTHQDLTPSNTILSDDGELVIIDWASLGWLPTWVEAVCLASPFFWIDAKNRDLYLLKVFKGIRPFSHALSSYYLKAVEEIGSMIP